MTPMAQFRVQISQGAYDDLEEARRIVKEQAKTISGWDEVYKVTVLEEPQLAARDGEVEE